MAYVQTVGDREIAFKEPPPFRYKPRIFQLGTDLEALYS